MQKKYFPVDELIAALKQNGFVFGVDTLLNLHNLLKSVDTETDFDDLPTYICPLFAQNQKQQQRFYELYRKVLKSYGYEAVEKKIQHTKIHEEPEQKVSFDAEELKPEKLKNRFVLYTLAALLTVFIAVLSFWYIYENNKTTAKITQPIVGNIDSLNTTEQAAKQIIDSVQTELEKTKQEKDSLLENTKDENKINEIKQDFEFRIRPKDSLINKKLTQIDSTKIKAEQEQRKLAQIESKVNL